MTVAACDKLVIVNPKRGAASLSGRDCWFPYYAGFSSKFAGQLIASSQLAPGAILMDPWNGSGTTTSAALLNGHKPVGFDVNPVMAVVAKARLLPQSEICSVPPLLADIVAKAKCTKRQPQVGDPLTIWFTPNAAVAVRSIERAIYRLLVSADQDEDALDSAGDLSTLAAFFYVALFRAVRSLVHPFRASNPTWIIRPVSPNCRIKPKASKVWQCFSDYVTQMVSNSSSMLEKPKRRASDFTIKVASSDNLPLGRETVDFVLSSPPYCTRIDYGIATLPELSVLGFEVNKRLGELRARLIGTPTVQSDTPEPSNSWGNACVDLLERVSNHRSKAARSYYYKTYVQYFSAMSHSFSELGRCLKRRGQCILVVQDSYFKDVHVDLATIFAEMGRAAALDLCHQVDFPINRTLGSVNLKSRRYRRLSSATESVLCFVKSAC